MKEARCRRIHNFTFGTPPTAPFWLVLPKAFAPASTIRRPFAAPTPSAVILPVDDPNYHRPQAGRRPSPELLPRPPVRAIQTELAYRYSLKTLHRGASACDDFALTLACFTQYFRRVYLPSLLGESSLAEQTRHVRPSPQATQVREWFAEA